MKTTILLALFGAAVLTAGPLHASELWTYTGPPLSAISGSDLSLRPPGLGDHFDISILFPLPLPVGTLNDLSNDWLDLHATMSWRDGGVDITAVPMQTSQLGAGTFAYIDVGTGQRVINLVGTAGFGGFFFGGALSGLDSLVICGSGSFDVCTPQYRESAASFGTWTIAQVPEPATWLLCAAGLGLAGLLRYNHRREHN